MAQKDVAPTSHTDNDNATKSVHLSFKSHTSGIMTLGRGNAMLMSDEQKLDTRCGTESKSVGAEDCIGMILWTRHL